MKIAVDPGHGMSNRTQNVFDSGATHREDGVLFQEADIALRYGLALKDALRARNHEVFMTRDDNQDHAPVGERAGNARRAGCDTFVSLHLNDADADQAHGIEVLFRDQPDRELAQSVLQNVLRATGLRNRGVVPRDNLAVLRFDGPAVLIELGFIANDGDRNILLNPQIRHDVSEGIVDALETSALSNRLLSLDARPTKGGPGEGYELPDYVRELLGQLPWTLAQRIAGMNRYEGLVRNSCHVFGTLQPAVFYEGKFAIDGDGSGGNQEGDGSHQPDTSLHDANGRPLNSRHFPFVVLPLPPREASIPKLDDFGVALGDVVLTFFKGQNGTHVVSATIYGDKGPRLRIGEGSMLAARELEINPDPNIGGIDSSQIPPGVVHIAFPGTRQLNQQGTTDTPESIRDRAATLFDALKRGGR